MICNRDTPTELQLAVPNIIVQLPNLFVIDLQYFFHVFQNVPRFLLGGLLEQEVNQFLGEEVLGDDDLLVVVDGFLVAEVEMVDRVDGEADLDQEVLLDLEEVVDFGHLVEELEDEDDKREDVEWDDDLNDKGLHLLLPVRISRRELLHNQPQYL